MTILEAATAHRSTPAGTVDADCCVWALDVLERAYGRDLDPAPLRALWCVWADDDGTVPTSRVWGPPVAAGEIGISHALLDTPVVGRWALCQGWRTLRPDGRADPAAGDRGHTWLWYASGEGVGVRVDSARSRGPRITGWEAWASLRETYRAGIRVAVLRPAAGR